MAVNVAERLVLEMIRLVLYFVVLPCAHVVARNIPVLPNSELAGPSDSVCKVAVPAVRSTAALVVSYFSGTARVLWSAAITCRVTHNKRQGKHVSVLARYAKHVKVCQARPVCVKHVSVWQGGVQQLPP